MTANLRLLSASALKRAAPQNLRDFEQHGIAAGWTAKTLETRLGPLQRITYEVGDLDTLDAQQITAWLADGDYSTATLYTYGNSLRAYYRWAVDAERVAKDPMRTIPKPSVARTLPKPITEDQLEDILETAPEWLRIASLGAAFAGLRCMELARWDRAHVTEETIAVDGGKGGKNAILPCHPRVWRAVRGLPPGLILHWPDGSPMSAHQVSARALRWFDANGHAGVSMHRLRHRYGTQLYRKTKDILVTSRLLRHSSVATTMIYTLLDDDAARGAVDLL